MKLWISQVKCKVGGKLDGPSGSRIAVYQLKYSRQTVTSAISEGTIPGQYFLTSFSITWKRGCRALGMVPHWGRSRRGAQPCRKWAARNMPEHSLGKCCVLPLAGRSPAVVQHETHGQESSSVVPVESKGHWHQLGTLWPQWLTRAWVILSSQWREGLLHCYMALIRWHPELSPI